ncbi:MAG TPA: hypothetical protein VHI52_17155, partial [Verrucomicrobiae bacterium]|nr:hypothetical protein [Verrucomicrobiae bacterium]
MASPANKWQHSYIQHWILPAALLASILLFDLFLLPRATITPVCSFLILVLLAFILPPVPMIFWAVIYAITTLVVIFNPDIFRPGTPNVALIHGIRSLGAVLGASVAVLLCFHRLKVGRQSEQLNLIVKEIRVPFVLSDANGEIILMNKQAAEILG